MTASGGDESGGAGAGRASRGPMNGAANGRGLLAVYRAACVTAGLLALAGVVGTEGPRLWAADAQSPERASLLLALVLAAIATALLGIHIPGGQEITIVGVPLVLAWWQLGLPEALGAAAVAALVGAAARRPSFGAGSGAAARTVLAAAAGLGLAQSLAPPGAPGPADSLPLPLPGPLLAAVERNAHLVLGRWLAGAVVAVVAMGLAWAAMDWLDTRLSSASVRRQRALPRLDLVTNLLLVPVTLGLQTSYVLLGFERFGILLAGAGALLVVVRASVNLRTVHAALAQTHGVVLEEREKLATLFSHSGEGIFTIDGRLHVSAVNPAMADLLGLDAGQIEGRACAEVCRFEDGRGGRLCPERCPLKRAFAERRPISQDVVLQAPEQPAKHLLLTYAAVRDDGGRLDQGIGIARDVSAQKEAEALRVEFVSLVTHELRNPLAVSMAYVGLMKRGLRAPPAAVDTQKTLHYLESIERSEQHLLRLVNNLLDVARVERTDLPLELEDVDLGRLLEDVARDARTLAEQKQQMVTLVAPEIIPPYWGSELYLREILNNLLSNAVKYTPDGGAVTVTVAAPAGEAVPATKGEASGRPPGQAGDAGPPDTASRWLDISVADTGYGMSEEDLGRLFTKFFRSGHAEVRKERGTGLGLALTKRMAERLGGSIHVSSDLGAGSTFTVRLPLVAPSEQATAGIAPADATSSA